MDAERNLVLVRGAVPGSEGGQVVIRPSLKAARLAKRNKIIPHQGGRDGQAWQEVTRS